MSQRGVKIGVMYCTVDILFIAILFPLPGLTEWLGFLFVTSFFDCLNYRDVRQILNFQINGRHA